MSGLSDDDRTNQNECASIRSGERAGQRSPKLQELLAIPEAINSVEGTSCLHRQHVTSRRENSMDGENEPRKAEMSSWAFSAILSFGLMLL